MCGFGGVPSARANLSRVLAKFSSDEDTTAVASTEGRETTQETPAGKKKGGGRKRANGEFGLSTDSVVANS